MTHSPKSVLLTPRPTKPPELHLNDRAWLARNHGITVCIETGGIAKCLHRDGSSAWYAIDTLKDIIGTAKGVTA